MNFLGIDVFQNIIVFFESIKDSLSIETLLFIFIGLEVFLVIVVSICVRFIYESRLLRVIDRINIFLYEQEFINESNLIELNSYMKRVPKTLRYYWQEFMLNRDKKPSYYMSVENCIDRPIKASFFNTLIKIVKSIGIIFAGVSFLFACGWASNFGTITADFYINVVTIPILILLINHLFIIILNAKFSKNTTDLYQSFNIFNKFIDKAVTTMPEYVDFEILFTEKEIKRGIPALNEYIEKRQKQEEEELKRAKENFIQHEEFNFDQTDLKGSLVLERAVRESEIYISLKNRLNIEIQHFENEIESLKKNFENVTKEYYKKLQASKENSQRLREQLESTTNRLENNYIRKQQSDEIKKQEQIEKEQDEAQLKFNQSINTLSEEIKNRKKEIEEGKLELEKAMTNEYNSFANKVYEEIRNIINEKQKESQNKLLKEKSQIEKELEEAYSKIDILEKKNLDIIKNFEKMKNQNLNNFEFKDEKQKIKDIPTIENNQEIDKETNQNLFYEDSFEKENETTDVNILIEEDQNLDDLKKSFGNENVAEKIEIEKPEKAKNQIVSSEPKKRGRPKKAENQNISTEPKKRGRPRKTDVQVIASEPKKRGRPKKITNQSVSTEQKKRGRPKKIDIDENLKQIEERLREQNELLKQQQKALEVTVKNATQPADE